MVVQLGIGVAGGGDKGYMALKLLENIVILCFEVRFCKQNSVIRLKWNILPPKFLGWLRYCSLAIAALNKIVHRNNVERQAL